MSSVAADAKIQGSILYYVSYLRKWTPDLVQAEFLSFLNIVVIVGIFANLIAMAVASRIGYRLTMYLAVLIVAGSLILNTAQTNWVLFQSCQIPISLVTPIFTIVPVYCN